MKGRLAVLVAMPLVFVACSGGSGSGSDSSNSVFGSNISAQFIDAPVKGLQYKNEKGVTSQTGEGGKFSCKRGETIEFSLGSFGLGYAACGSKIFIHDLASAETGYSWPKAAAVIQSFAGPANAQGILDLSSITQSGLNFGALSYNDVGFDATLVTVVGDNKTSGVAPATAAAVSVAAATAHADGSLSDHIALPSQLEFVLGQLATNNEVIKLKGKLNKQVYVGGEPWCWENIEATANVSEANGTYKFNITGAVSWDNDSSLATAGVCTSGEESADECENSASSDLPGAKVITGSSFDMVFSNEKNEPEIGGDVKYSNTLSLNAVVGSGSVTVKGIFQSNVKAIGSNQYAGTELNCQYAVTSSSEVQTSYEAQKPAAGTYTGDLTCDDAGSTQKAVTVAVNASLAAALSVDASSVGTYTFKHVVEDAFKKYYEIEVGTEDQDGYLYMGVVDQNTLHVLTQATVSSVLVTCGGNITL